MTQNKEGGRRKRKLKEKLVWNRKWRKKYRENQAVVRKGRSENI